MRCFPNSRKAIRPLNSIRGTAPAKINLALHVGSARPDGLHRLASLIAFCELGEEICIDDCEGLEVEVAGHHAPGVPEGASNLAHRAAELVLTGRGARIRIHKRIPAAGGLGGGSTDAAVVLKLLSSNWNLPMPSIGALMELGADVPACVAGEPALVSGAGECVELADCVPLLPIVIANPRVAVSTRSVFEAHSGQGLPELALPASGCQAGEFIAWLCNQRNDLQAAAISLEPCIAEVLERLERLEGCLLARMSGSGSSCYGIFSCMAEAKQAAGELKAAKPDWWIAATSCLPSRAAVRSSGSRQTPPTRPAP